MDDNTRYDHHDHDDPGTQRRVDDDRTKASPDPRATAIEVRTDEGLTHQITGRTFVGRSPVADPAELGGALIVLSDESGIISDTHAVLDVVGGTLRVSDLHSAHGTSALIGSTITVLSARRWLELPPDSRLYLGERWIDVVGAPQHSNDDHAAIRPVEESPSVHRGTSPTESHIESNPPFQSTAASHGTAPQDPHASRSTAILPSSGETVPNSAGPDSIEPDSAGPDSTGPDSTGPDSTEPDSAGPDPTGPTSVEPDDSFAFPPPNVPPEQRVPQRQLDSGALTSPPTTAPPGDSAAVRDDPSPALTSEPQTAQPPHDTDSATPATVETGPTSSEHASTRPRRRRRIMTAIALLVAIALVAVLGLVLFRNQAEQTTDKFAGQRLATNPTLMWQTTIDGGNDTTPISVRFSGSTDRLFVYDETNKEVIAFDSGGTRIWSNEIEVVGLDYYDGDVIVVQPGGSDYVLSRWSGEDGEQMWSSRVDQASYSTFADTAFIEVDVDHIISIDLATGERSASARFEYVSDSWRTQLDNDGVFVVYESPSSAIVLDRTLQPIGEEIDIGSLGNAAFQGDSILVTASTEYTRYDVDGNKLATATYRAAETTFPLGDNLWMFQQDQECGVFEFEGDEITELWSESSCEVANTHTLISGERYLSTVQGGKNVIREVSTGEQVLVTDMDLQLYDNGVAMFANGTLTARSLPVEDELFTVDVEEGTYLRFFDNGYAVVDITTPGEALVEVYS